MRICILTVFRISQSELDVYLASLKSLAEDDASSITYFSEHGEQQGTLTADRHKATPKLFDANSRVCGTHLTYGMTAFAQMLRLYAREFEK